MRYEPLHYANIIIGMYKFIKAAKVIVLFLIKYFIIEIIILCKNVSYFRSIYWDIFRTINCYKFILHRWRCYFKLPICLKTISKNTTFFHYSSHHEYSWVKRRIAISLKASVLQYCAIIMVMTAAYIMHVELDRWPIFLTYNTQYMTMCTHFGNPYRKTDTRRVVDTHKFL